MKVKPMGRRDLQLRLGLLPTTKHFQLSVTSRKVPSKKTGFRKGKLWAEQGFCSPDLMENKIQKPIHEKYFAWLSSTLTCTCGPEYLGLCYWKPPIRKPSLLTAAVSKHICRDSCTCTLWWMYREALLASRGQHFSACCAPQGQPGWVHTISFLTENSLLQA